MALSHDLLILGSQNAKEADQRLTRDEIHPVQILRKDGTVEPVRFFDSWGRVGVSSIATVGPTSDELFISVNDYILRFNLRTQEKSRLAIERIGDIHDIHFINGLLWISSTEYDEAIAFDTDRDKVVRRVSLSRYREELDDDHAAQKVKDRFHCNQVFTDYEGRLSVLIHHISGWQFYKVLFEKFVKKQGDGGVINLETDEVYPLGLMSPHTMRKVNGEYWVQDSGDFSIKKFDKAWNPVGEIELYGFGRGVDFSEKESVMYVALSATRKRYLNVIPGKAYEPNRIVVLNLETEELVQKITIPNIEQLDNIYILSPRRLDQFLQLEQL